MMTQHRLESDDLDAFLESKRRKRRKMSILDVGGDDGSGGDDGGGGDKGNHGHSGNHGHNGNHGVEIRLFSF